MISNPPIFKLLLDNSDTYPFAEERRLFYVALTRVKKKAFLIVEKGNESIFIKELYKNGDHHKEVNICPNCGGKLIYIRGQYGSFLGCSNYKKLGCIYKQKL